MSYQFRIVSFKKKTNVVSIIVSNEEKNVSLEGDLNYYIHNIKLKLCAKRVYAVSE